MKKVDISKKELYDLYINQNLSVKEIAFKFNVSKSPIERRLRECKIKKDKKMAHLKTKQTIQKKYGVDNISKLETNKEKVRQTNLRKYGKTCYLQTEEGKERVKQTNLKKYGVEKIFYSDKIQEKIKNTMLEKYGTINPMQNEKIKNKSKDTNLRKYGVYTTLKLDVVKDKIRNTNLKKYGVPYSCMTNNCRKASGKTISKTNKIILKKIVDNGIEAIAEKNLENFSYDIELIKQKKLIEINPTYTHNSTIGVIFNKHQKTPISSTYHFNKTIVAKKNGYQCIHIWDWDNCDKIINMLKPKKTIYARKCYCKNISKEQCNDFLETYHLQGSCRGQKVLLGLFYNNKLVEVMIFGKPRYNSKYEWELLRLCSVFDYNIIGGASKLFFYFIEKCNPKNIISYCDNSKFNGNVYKTLGFKLLSYGNPSKHWYNMKTKQHITDNLLRQRGYDQLFNTNYGKGSSNKELMIQNGFVEIYDCGQSTYTWKNNSF